jgi:alpha-L-fucosidase
MTDDTISRGSWCYTNTLTIKPAADIIHALADTVAKNGIVLLNISPMADGTIPQDQRKTLKGIGEWMKINGEAIYATRSWIVFGEGPTKEPGGGFGDANKFLNLKYSAKDFRFTRSKDGKRVYAIMLGWPETGDSVNIKSLATDKLKITAVSLLGCDEQIEWTQTTDGLSVTLPNTRISDIAVAFRVAAD